MRKFTLMLAFLLFAGLNFAFAQTKTISGTVTSADNGSALPGVTVLVKGTTNGTVTDANGKYSLQVGQNAKTLVFSFVGMKTQEIPIAGRSVINVVMSSTAISMNEVVVTALGISRQKKTLAYSAQDVKSAELNMVPTTNINSAIAGKVAGVQVQTQAGSKLGYSGKIRIRGAISMTSDAGPLYVIDGIPTNNPNSIDMDNVASVSVLKGPNATALYGQRAESGVVVITTKKTKQSLYVAINSSTTFDKVSYLPEYQNLYGGGYEGDAAFGTFNYNGQLHNFYPKEWKVLDGARHLLWDNNYADESWGPKFDGKPYAPWYVWWPGTKDNPNPYYGKQVPYVAQPDNIKDFYETGVTSKNSITVGGSNDKYDARFSYTNIYQNGIIPYSDLKKNMFFLSGNYKLDKHLSFGADVNFSKQSVQGDFNDSYANQTSGSFNQWFDRNNDIHIMKELKDLKTIDGYTASWNWWGPNYYAYMGNYRGVEGFKKPAFWYNPYTWLENFKQVRERSTLLSNLHADYAFNKHFDLNVMVTTNRTNYAYRYEFPFVLSHSAAPNLYNPYVNAFGIYNSSAIENNYSTKFTYKESFNHFDVHAFVGGNIRYNRYNRASTQIPYSAHSGGLILPDVYLFSNASKLPATRTYRSEKKVYSLYGNVSVGFKSMLYLDASYRQDWSSALPANNNGYGYPSVGLSFIFTQLMKNIPALSFGKVRVSWAQVGNDIGAYMINPVYPISSNTYKMSNGVTTAPMYTITSKVSPDLRPALNTSFETGFDLKFVKNRIGLSFTYYNETRKDEIIPVSLSYTTGYTTTLINAGESRRRGVEIVLTATPIKTKNFRWDITFNFAQNKTWIVSLPEGLKSMHAPGGSDNWGFVGLYHYLGDNWGQLRGTAISRNKAGLPVLDSVTGLYETKPGQYLGSVLPDYTGGIINTFSYKGIHLNAAIDFQHGGKFFSLSEMWGQYSGLMATTASINDKGHNVRDKVSDGGGVHVKGVDQSGKPVDKYVNAKSYYKQWYSNKLAEPFIHNASYVKLREVSLTYDLPKKWFSRNFVKSISLGVVARDVWLISVSKDNINRWDPSELAHTYGENAQLPGTRSFGFNLNVTF